MKNSLRICLQIPSWFHGRHGSASLQTHAETAVGEVYKNPILSLFAMFAIAVPLMSEAQPAPPSAIDAKPASTVPTTQPRKARSGPGGAGEPVKLGPDDKQVYPNPPSGFDVERKDIAHGKLQMVEYESKTVGTTRKLLVYTPPRYSDATKYPAMYLLHGIGGDETEWKKHCAPGVILDNLIADGKIPAMIVLFPNCRAEVDDHPRDNIFNHSKAFETFTDDLISGVIPYVESHYSVIADSEHRALGGYSMGGGQTLNIGLTHLDKFSYLAAMSTAPNVKSLAELIPDPKALESLKVFYISCGDKDGFMARGQSWHAYLKKNNVKHIWQVNPGGHDAKVWKQDLYHFSQLVFK